MAPEMMTVNDNPNVSGWSLDFGYTNKVPFKNEYPQRLFNFESYKYLYITFQIEKSINDQCKEINEGIKVMFNVPGDSLKISRNYYRAPFFKKTYSILRTKLITTTDGAQKYTSSQRQCFYSYERKLKFFRNYTQINCEAEFLVYH